MKRKRIIIIGGLTAGPSAAAKARRTNENAEIILFEKTAHISYATCGIPYALSGKIKTQEKLMVIKPELLKKPFRVDLHLNEPVVNIDPKAHVVITEKRNVSLRQAHLCHRWPSHPPDQGTKPASNPFPFLIRQF